MAHGIELMQELGKGKNQGCSPLMTGAAFPQGQNASLQAGQRDTARGHGGREPHLGGLCGEGSRGRGFSTSRLTGKEFEECMAQFPWSRKGTGMVSAEAVGVQDRDSPTAQPQVALCCRPQYSHQSGQSKFPLTHPSGGALHYLTDFGGQPLA